MSAIIEYLNLVLLGYSALLPIANPLTSMTLLMTLGQGFTPQERRKEINLGTLYVVGIMVVCFYGGTAVMNLFGISIPGLRIAGGLVVMYIGFTMLFPGSRHDERESQAEMAPDKVVRPPSIAFVPLAMPGTAGPGTIALIISGAASITGSAPLSLHHHLAALTVFSLLGLTFWLCLRSATSIVKWLGEAGIDAFARVMGFLLICMGVQFVINGALEVIPPDQPAHTTALR